MGVRKCSNLEKLKISREVVLEKVLDAVCLFFLKRLNLQISLLLERIYSVLHICDWFVEIMIKNLVVLTGKQSHPALSADQTVRLLS